MIMITQKARHHIKEMLVAKNRGPGIGMRLVLKPNTGKFALKFDKEREHDHVISHNNSKVLLIEKAIFDRSGFLTIDFGGIGSFPRLFIVQR